jgi:Flp pilus assembly protein TadD
LLFKSNLRGGMAPTLGFSMIVKNGAATLRNCLASVHDVVSELIVGDTGSSDGSQEIAREFEARVIDIAWESDFAAARNAALSQCATDWVLTLDADEELDSEAPAELLRLTNKPKFGGYAVPVRNYLPLRHGNVNGNRAQPNDGRSKTNIDAPSYAEHLVVRLFRRHPAITYQGCVHETIAPQILAAGFTLGRSTFCVHHSGYLAAPQQYADKAEFYLHLLRRKVQLEPRSPLAWLELARQLHEPFRRNQEALACAARSIELEPGMAAAWFLSGVVHLDMGHDNEAIAALERCAGDAEHAAECEHYRGDALHNLGRFADARIAYRRCLAVVDHDPQVESKLGYVEVRMGEHELGFAKLEAAIEILPRGAELHERLIKACISSGHLAEAAAAAERFATVVPHPKTFMRAAAIRAHMKDEYHARRLLNQGLEFFPQSADLRTAQDQLESAHLRGKAAHGA